MLGQLTARPGYLQAVTAALGFIPAQQRDSMSGPAWQLVQTNRSEISSPALWLGMALSARCFTF